MASVFLSGKVSSSEDGDKSKSSCSWSMLRRPIQAVTSVNVLSASFTVSAKYESILLILLFCFNVLMWLFSPSFNWYMAAFGLASGGGVHASGLKVSNLYFLLWVVIFTVFLSLSPCTLKAWVLAVSLLTYVLRQCQHWYLVTVAV